MCHHFPSTKPRNVVPTGARPAKQRLLGVYHGHSEMKIDWVEEFAIEDDPEILDLPFKKWDFSLVNKHSY